MHDALMQQVDEAGHVAVAEEAVEGVMVGASVTLKPKGILERWTAADAAFDLLGAILDVLGDDEGGGELRGGVSGPMVIASLLAVRHQPAAQAMSGAGDHGEGGKLCAHMETAPL